MRKLSLYQIQTVSHLQSENSRLSYQVLVAGGGGGGGHSYIIEDMDVRQGLSDPYPLQTNISAKFWTLCRQMAENFQKYIP